MTDTAGKPLTRPIASLPARDVPETDTTDTTGKPPARPPALAPARDAQETDMPEPVGKPRARKPPARPSDSADVEDTSMTDTARTPATRPPATGPPRPELDPEHLRLSQDFRQVGVRRTLTTVPVRRPDRQTFVHVHPGEAWRLPTAMLNLREQGEYYIVNRPLWEELQAELVPTMLFTAITRQKVPFLWPVRLPGEDGRLDRWSRSALDAADLASRGWVRVAANRALGAYEVFEPTVAYPDPEWPTLDFTALLEIAFRDSHIRTLDHPVVRRLRGAG